MPNLSDLEAVTDCSGAARAPHENGGWSIGANAMRSVLALGLLIALCASANAARRASLQTATCHRSSQPSCGPTLSAGPPRPDPSLRRSIQVWRRLICGDLKGLLETVRGCPMPAWGQRK